MATNTETIKNQIEIKLNGAQDAAEAVAALESGLAQLQNAYREWKKELKKKGGSDQAIEKEMAENKRAQAAFGQSLKDSNKQLKTFTTSATHADGSLNNLNERLKNARAEFYALSSSERDAGKRGKELRKEISELNSAILKQEQSIGRSQRNVGNYGTALKGLRDVVLRMGFGVLGVAQGMVALGARIKEGIETAIHFNREISKLSAITQGSQKDIAALEAEAKRLGSTTRYTATQVAELQVELAKLGYGKGDILAMSESVLNLAQATGSSLADAAALAGAALRIFGDDSTQLTKYVDQMSTAVSKSALSFDYIKTALPIVGGAADMFGFDLQDTLALLGQLANSGMEASMAATATRNIFLKLADSNGVLNQQLGKTPETLDELLDGLEELRIKGANLNDALEMTNVRSAVAFTRFMNSVSAARELAKSMDYAAISNEELTEKANEAGITVAELRKQMEICNGTAKDMAEIMEDNLGGEITRLSSAWDDFVLSLNGSQGILQWIVNKTKELVTYIGDIIRSVPESEKQQVSKGIKDYTQSEKFTSKVDSDIKKYQERVKELVASGEKMKDAAIKAQTEILDAIDRETNNTLTSQAESAKKAMDSFRDLHGFDDKSYEELNRIYKNNRNTQWAQNYYKKMIDLWDAYSAAQAELEAQENRKNAFSIRANKRETTDGLGIEDDAARNKRLQREKSAAKALLAARQAYENAELKIAKESRDKQLEIVKNQYKHEIENLQIKIDEELKMRGDESAKEAADKLAAIEYYKLAIADKEKDRDREIANVNYEWLQNEYKYLKEYTDLSIDAISNSSDDELFIIKNKYKLRLDLLNKEEEKEIAALEVAATKDAKIAEQKEKRLTLIKQKYINKRNELDVKDIEEVASALTRNIQAMELDMSDSPMAVLNLKLQEAQLNFQKLQDETYRATKTDSELALEEAQAWNVVLQSLDAISEEKIKMATQDEELAKLIRIDDNGDMRASNALEQAQSEVEIARMKYEQISNIGKLELETEQQYQLRKAQAYRDYVTARESLAQKELQIASTVSSSVIGGLESITNAIADASDKNKTAAKLAKILGLAQIWINNGIAISEAVKTQSSGDPYTMYARIAAAIAQIASGTISAVSSANKVKFAKGVVNLQGAGTTTSDSINARLSQGESVMTARATDMFGNLLTIMNHVAAQPHVTLPTTYAQYNPMQTAANNDGFNASMREAVADIHPVVAVEEINRVGKRYNNIKVLDNI